MISSLGVFFLFHKGTVSHQDYTVAYVLCSGMAARPQAMFASLPCLRGEYRYFTKTALVNSVEKVVGWTQRDKDSGAPPVFRHLSPVSDSLLLICFQRCALFPCRRSGMGWVPGRPFLLTPSCVVSEPPAPDCSWFSCLRLLWCSPSLCL